MEDVGVGVEKLKCPGHFHTLAVNFLVDIRGVVCKLAPVATQTYQQRAILIYRQAFDAFVANRDLLVVGPGGYVELVL